MAETSSFVIQYLADLSSVKKQLAELESLNKKTSSQLGQDFSRAVNIVDRRLKSLRSKPVFDKELGKNVIKTFAQFETVFQTADGRLRTFRENTIQTAEGFKILSTSAQGGIKSISELTKQQTEFLGKSSKLATNFNNLNDVTNKFSGQLKNFGQITNISSGALTKVTDDTKKFSAVAQLSDGTLLKLTETVKKTANGIQIIGRTVEPVKAALNKLQGTSSALATNFNNLNNVNQTFANQLKGSGQAIRLIGTSLDQVSSTGSKTSKIFETTDGKFVKLTQTVKKLPNGIQDVNRSVQQMSKSQAENANTLERVSANARSFGQNIVELAKRAALTIPIWFALRNSIFGVFRTIRDGLKNLAEFDKALQKLGRNIQATSTNFGSDFKKAEEAITSFSIRSGQSVESITNAIQKFATVGFDFETALSGGIDSTKLAVALFGDAEETADAFSRALRILVDTSAPVEQQQREIAEALSLTSKLWETNQFDINEVNQALEKFAPVAKTTNLSMKETLTLLATLGTAATGGARGGTLLRTTLQKMLENLDDVSKALNIQVNPAMDSTFSTILKVIDASVALGDSFEAVVERSEILSEVFGGVRGSLPLQSLTATGDLVKENFKLIATAEDLDNTFEDQIKKLNRLVERHQNLNKEMGKAFVTGLLGSGNYEKALASIVKAQEGLLDDVDRLGGGIRNTFVSIGVGALVGFSGKVIATVKALGSVSAVLDAITARLAILKASAATPVVVSVIGTLVFLNLVDQLDRLLAEEVKVQREFNDFGKKLAQNIEKGLEGELNFDEINDVIATLEVFGAKNLGFDNVTFDKTLTILKEIREEERNIADVKKQQTAENKKQETTNAKRKQIAELVLQNELELLKAQGARNSEITQAEQLLRKQFNIEKDILGQMELQLKKQREVREERRLQSELGDESIKLFRIAQKEGTETARTIGEVLSGDRDFANFVRAGGKELEIFKRDFGDLFEQQQALAFGRGDTVPGLSGLRGGSRVGETFREQEALNGSQTRSTFRAQSTQDSLVRQELDSRKVDEERNTALISNTEQLKQLNDNLKTNSIVGSVDSRGQVVSDLSVLREQFNRGIALVGNDAPRLIQATTQEARRFVQLSIDIDGRNFDFQGEAGALRQFAQQITSDPNIIQAIENQIVNSLDNPQSKVSKKVNERIENF